MTPEQLQDIQELIDKFHPSSASEAELKRRCRKAIENIEISSGLQELKAIQEYKKWYNQTEKDKQSWYDVQFINARVDCKTLEQETYENMMVAIHDKIGRITSEGHTNTFDRTDNLPQQ